MNLQQHYHYRGHVDGPATASCVPPALGERRADGATAGSVSGKRPRSQSDPHGVGHTDPCGVGGGASGPLGIEAGAHRRDDDQAPPARLSRHIPHRDDMDMTVSAYNLTTGGGAAPLDAHTRPAGGRGVFPVNGAGGTGAPGAGSLSTGMSSFSESFVSDDSSFATSLYNELLADKLVEGNSRKLGGDVLRFGMEATREDGDGMARANPSSHGRSAPTMPSSPRSVASSSTSFGNAASAAGSAAALSHDTASAGGEGRWRRSAPAPASPLSPRMATTLGSSSVASRAGLHRHRLLSLAPEPGLAGGAKREATGGGSLYQHASGGTLLGGRYGHHGPKKAPARVLLTNPQRVLDAPGFPAGGSQLLDWGGNNKLLIGLGSTVYLWDAEEKAACKMVDLQDRVRVRCIQWLHRDTCVAMSVEDGTTAIFDHRSSSFLRTVKIPHGGGDVACIAINGPVLAAGSTGSAGNIYVYDLRTKEALIAVYEAHRGPVASLQYCASEPFYLASGGGEDGCVRVWDARRSSRPSYSIDKVHRGSVNSVCWCPDKRTTLFTGGQDGALMFLDTHAVVPALEPTGAEATMPQYVVRAVNTMQPISGIVTPGSNVGEVATAHYGRGQIQLRKAASFQMLGTFTAPSSTSGMSCLTLAPDKEMVCAAQEDETLKFWKVFDVSSAHQSSRWKDTSLPPSAFDEELR